MKAQARLFLTGLVACLLPACGSGLVAPTGTDLSGRWRSDTHRYSAGGTSVSVYFEFMVDSSSSQVTSLRMYNSDSRSSYVSLVGTYDDGFLPDRHPRTVAINGGVFEVKLDNPNITCNGTKLSYSFKGTFRSATRADGDWSDTNLGPAGYTFCGTQSFDWSANKM